jgi:archaeal cell division control protein 6
MVKKEVASLEAGLKDLDKIFDSFDKNRIFKDKVILQSNYKPETILHRGEQVKQIASILAPVLRGEKTSNLFLYGKTGTGKTLSIQYVRDELLRRAEKNLDSNLKILYLNCKLKKVSDTEYRILADLIKKLGGEVPSTGLPTESVYNKFVDLVDSDKQLIVLILDEIDYAVKKISDGFLYSLTRLNSELAKAQICVVGISNDLTFLEGLDPRVKSSLSEEELVFPPYKALQIQDILKVRSEMAFREKVLEDGVISKCAAFAAREHGDARRALDLLRVAGELAERDDSGVVTQKHTDLANEKIERDKVLDVVRMEPRQFQLVLLAIIKLLEDRRNKNLKGGQGGPVFTGDVYNLYQDFCRERKESVLTQRRVSDIVQEFDMLGIINVRVISKGRGGRMREIKLAITDKISDKVKEIIYDSLDYN